MAAAYQGLLSKIKDFRLHRVYFGWWTVLAGGILALWGHGYHSYGFSALFKPIASELGFSRAVTSVAASIGRFEGGIEAPITGWVTDRFGPRWIVIGGVATISLSLILMRYINSLAGFYVVWGMLLGTGCNIALTLPLDTAISNWFVKKRGLALSIKWVFSGMSGALVMPLVTYLITQVGWRDTCFIGGLVMGIVGLPLAWFFLRQHRPEYYGLLPDGAVTEEEITDSEEMLRRGVEYAAEAEEVEFTVRQAMKTRPFWLLITAQMVHSLIVPVMSIHCIPFLTDRNIDPVRAAGMMAIWVTASIPARFVGGVIADRMRIRHLRFVKGGAYLLQAIGVAVFLQFQTETSIYIWFVMYGVGQGIAMTVNPVMRARYFGRKGFGSIAGFSRMFMTPIGVLGPVYAGWIYDTTGSYMNAFVQFAIMLVVSAAISVFIVPPKPPGETTDVRRIM